MKPEVAGLEKRTAPPAAPAASKAAFRSLLISEGVFDLGVFMRTAVVSWVLLELTGSQLWVGAGAGVRAVPVLILALAGGILADRMPRRGLLSVSMLAMAGLVAVMAVITVTGVAEPWHYLALTVGIGAAAALHGPAFYALVADLVTAERLPRANGLISFVTSVGEMAGSAVVGFIIASSGAGAAFWATAGLFALGAALLIRVNPPVRHARQARKSALRDVREGLAYARRTQPLPWLIVLVMSQNLLGVAIFPLMPVYARDVLDVGVTGFGVMGAVFGAGLLCSSVIVMVFGVHRRRSMVLLVTGAVWDIGMVAFGFSRSYPLSLAALFMMGLAGTIWVNAVLTMFQRAATEHMRGRVMSLYVLAMNMFPLGWLYGGAVAAWIGNEEALLISALGGTPVLLVALFLSPRLRAA